MKTERVVPLAPSIGHEPDTGPVAAARRQGRGPAIWLAGDPDDLKEWMPLGVAGIVTNTVVHNQYAKAHGGAIDVIKKYLDLTDKPIVVEIDGHSIDELLEVGKAFTNLSGPDRPEDPVFDECAEGLRRCFGKRAWRPAAPPSSPCPRPSRWPRRESITSCPSASPSRRRGATRRS